VQGDTRQYAATENYGFAGSGRGNTRGLLPMLEEDLKTLEKAYTSKRK